jgi:hypothetical protein
MSSTSLIEVPTHVQIDGYEDAKRLGEGTDHKDKRQKTKPQKQRQRQDQDKRREDKTRQDVVKKEKHNRRLSA